MGDKVANSVEEVLKKTNASAGDLYADDLGNRWLIKSDRDGLKLEIEDHADAWIPYWTAIRIQLPGLHKVTT